MKAVALALLLLACPLASAQEVAPARETPNSAAQDAEFAARSKAWQAWLEADGFSFLNREGLLFEALLAYSGPCELHLVRDADQPPDASGQTKQHAIPQDVPLSIKLVRGRREILALPCRPSDTFTAAQNAFFIASHPEFAQGCTVRAYDMSTGKLMWETDDLTGFEFGGHSAYGNAVKIRATHLRTNADTANDAVVVLGRESFGDYKTVIDVKTGKTLAHKIYRKDFAKIPNPR